MMKSKPRIARKPAKNDRDPRLDLFLLAGRGLDRALREKGAGKVTLRVGSRSVEIPDAVAKRLPRMLIEMARVKDPSIANQEMTTQQAADYLGVSRPFLIKQIDNGELPCRKIGTHRRILRADLILYEKNISAMRQKTLDELTLEGQKLGLGY